MKFWIHKTSILLRIFLYFFHYSTVITIDEWIHFSVLNHFKIFFFFSSDNSVGFVTLQFVICLCIGLALIFSSLHTDWISWFHILIHTQQIKRNPSPDSFIVVLCLQNANSKTMNIWVKRIFFFIYLEVQELYIVIKRTYNIESVINIKLIVVSCCLLRTVHSQCKKWREPVTVKHDDGTQNLSAIVFAK